MKKRLQRIFGWPLFLSGILLVVSTFLPELLQHISLRLNQTDLISIYLGAIIYAVLHTNNECWNCHEAITLIPLKEELVRAIQDEVKT